jgi:hypothetical protein
VDAELSSFFLLSFMDFLVSPSVSFNLLNSAAAGRAYGVRGSSCPYSSLDFSLLSIVR